jgi:hypothetical protein
MVLLEIVRRSTGGVLNRLCHHRNHELKLTRIDWLFCQILPELAGRSAGNRPADPLGSVLQRD